MWLDKACDPLHWGICDTLQGMVFCYQNCSSDREKLLKFEAESRRENAKFLRSLEQFIQTVKG